MTAPRQPKESVAYPRGHFSVPLAHRDEWRLGWKGPLGQWSGACEVPKSPSRCHLAPNSLYKQLNSSAATLPARKFAIH